MLKKFETDHLEPFEQCFTPFSANLWKFYVFINNVNRTCDRIEFRCLRHVADIDSFKWTPASPNRGNGQACVLQSKDAYRIYQQAIFAAALSTGKILSFTPGGVASRCFFQHRCSQPHCRRP